MMNLTLIRLAVGTGSCGCAGDIVAFADIENVGVIAVNVRFVLSDLRHHALHLSHCEFVLAKVRNVRHDVVQGIDPSFPGARVEWCRILAAVREVIDALRDDFHIRYVLWTIAVASI